MKFLLASLCVLIVLANGAYCTKASIKPVIREHFQRLSLQHLREEKEESLKFVEQMIADMLADAGDEFCRGTTIDWERAITIVEERGKEIDIEGETLCALIRNHIEHVFEPLTTTLDQCGQAGRSGPLGSSLISALKSVVKHICNINGEQIFEMVNTCSFEGRFTAPECDRFMQGFDSLRPGNTTGTFVEDLCELLPLGRDCFLDEVSQECKLEFTKKAWEDLLNSIIIPCHFKNV